MEKFTIIGDPHAKNANLKQMKELCQKVEDMAQPTIWLGDMLDTKEVIRGNCLNFWYEYFHGSQLEHITLIGNHDFFNLECEDHSLKTLKSLGNVTIIDDLQMIRPNVYAIPYIHCQEKLKKILKRLPKNSVLFGHLEISNFDFGNGFICENGTAFKQLHKFKRVVSGHFHKFQEKDNFTYLGTPFSHSHGETNQEKFIATYDLEKDEFIKIPTGFPQHRTIEVKLGEYNEYEYLDNCLNKQDFFRILLIGTQREIDAFQKSQFLDTPNLRFLERPTDANINADIDETLDNTTQFEVWAKDIQSLDSDTVNLGLEILGDLK